MKIHSWGRSDKMSAASELRNSPQRIRPLADQRSTVSDRRSERSEDSQSAIRDSQSAIHIALLTGGGDKPYALGMAAALTSAGITVDFIGSDELSVPELLCNPRVNFLNLRGDQRPNVGAKYKAVRVLRYYSRLIVYAAWAKPKIFHLLWNNKFELFDRTLLMLYYKLLGKVIILTAHNVNAGKRDLTDTPLNRLSLKVQYKLSDHIFVHTPAMKRELVTEFCVHESKVTVVPFGINNTVPKTGLTPTDAKTALGLEKTDKTILFFGNIAPYKGLELLVSAFNRIMDKDQTYKLIVAGNPRPCDTRYWERVSRSLSNIGANNRVIARIEHVSDNETEIYFKAADVLVLPYMRIFQSGVLFLGYSFGLPTIAAAVGSLKDEIVEGKTGFTFEPGDFCDLADRIEQYFNSEIFRSLETQRLEIVRYANKRYSWDEIGEITGGVYSHFLISRRNDLRPSGESGTNYAKCYDDV